MPKFLSERDINFFHGLNLELVDEIIETPVIFYVLIHDKQTLNLYRESTNKLFEPGIKINALIQHDDEITTTDSDAGTSIEQNILAAFYRNSLKELDFYPNWGDVIKWNNAYFEVNGIIDNQLLGSRIGLPHSVLVSAHMIDRSSINVRQEL